MYFVLVPSHTTLSPNNNVINEQPSSSITEANPGMSHFQVEANALAYNQLSAEIQNEVFRLSKIMTNGAT
jgi:hypothetical protein